jgi:hypothetical protein
MFLAREQRGWVKRVIIHMCLVGLVIPTGEMRQRFGVNGLESRVQRAAAAGDRK